MYNIACDPHLIASQIAILPEVYIMSVSGGKCEWRIVLIYVWGKKTSKKCRKIHSLLCKYIICFSNECLCVKMSDHILTPLVANKVQFLILGVL